MHRVSLCIPTFNGEPFILDALRSVKRQTFTNVQIVVSDDKSTDGTVDVVRSLSEGRIILDVSPRRRGLVGNWNRCIELATGDYVQVFHQDDVLRPSCLERLAETLDKNPSAGFAFTNVEVIDRSGDVIGGHWNSVLPARDVTFKGIDFVRLLLGEGNLVPCQAVMVRRSCYTKAGSFDPRLRYTPDLEMWLRLALRWDVAYVAEPLVLLRRHPGQESSNFLGRAQEVDEVWRAFRILFSEQADLIPGTGSLYRTGMGHLLKWTLGLLREHMKMGHTRPAGELGLRLGMLLLASLRGPRGLALDGSRRRV